MMRNSINSYLTTLVMVLALLLSANAFAAETVTSSITIDNKPYALYTGFTATAGTYSTAGQKDFSKVVDGIIGEGNVDPSSTWHPIKNYSEEFVESGYAYLEFSSDVPIILKGYILNSWADGWVSHPTDRRLYAKANEEDTYELVSVYTDDKFSGIENYFSVDNEDNNQYRYFRFEGTNSNLNFWLREIRLYGENEFTYGFMPKKSATCTAIGYKQDCYLRSDGKYFTDETGTTEIPQEDVVDPIVPHTFLDESGETLEFCSICGGVNLDHNHGYCGDPEVNDGKDVTWRVTQEEDGNYTLTISGTGRMADYGNEDNAPWRGRPKRNYLDKITKFVVEEGVTSVGVNACYKWGGLKDVKLPNSITEINPWAFGYCSSLESINIPYGVTTVGYSVFYGCTALTKVEIPCSLEYATNWNIDESVIVKYHAFENQPFIDGEDGTHHQNCKCGNTTSTPESHAFTVEDITIDGGNESAATCTEKAKYYKSCVCGALSTSEVFEVGEPLGHSWGEYHLDGDQTCSEDGHKTARCSRIGCTETHTIEATGDALGTTYGAVCAYNDDSKAIIDGNSETSVLLPWNIDVDAIELNRTFAAGTISTITLPFSMYVENVEGAVFYRFKYVSSDDWTVHVGSVRDELIANTPYLVKTSGETISFKTGATLERTLDASPTDQGQDEGDGWELRGTYGKMVWKEGHPDLGYVYGFAAENVADVHIGEFVKATAGANLSPMRAYLYYNPVATPAPSPKPSFRGMTPMARSTTFSIEPPNYLDVVVDDDEGGTLYIGKLNTRTGEFNAAGDRWFDLKGRKLNGKPSVKGSFFNNKSKVIVK